MEKLKKKKDIVKKRIKVFCFFALKNGDILIFYEK